MKKLLLLIAILPFMISCQDTFNGKDEQSFKTSREKIEKSLDQNEKTNLEKAMRVVATEAMRVKWEEPEKYDGKSFNTISLEMIDGLSYSSVIDLAEDILKDRNKKEIEQLTSEIDSLNIQKEEFSTAQKTLNLFKISSLKINKQDFFDELIPQLEIDYQYIGKNKLVGPKEIGFKLLKKSTNEVLKSQSIIQGDNESVMESGETITENLILGQTKETNPKLWNAPKYPIENPNLANYDLELKVTVLSLVLNGKKVEMPEANTNQLDAEIKNKKEQIEELKTVKGTLDELELTE
ncbi:hypothetical protein J2X31_003613 [Flavobacterium arsenatis]|uniref:Lipoprotein n=1 Tax=Flavobacterium arsenatis TaxID=1484332 RepID=A0ABU1TUP7_9FLAO|nr:hypothetical protein [Flavobacterium arsenatis]MDR6969580.1 hypothetical protein [Flavobacterium arsenatis]